MLPRGRQAAAVQGADDMMDSRAARGHRSPRIRAARRSRGAAAPRAACRSLIWAALAGMALGCGNARGEGGSASGGESGGSPAQSPPAGLLSADRAEVQLPVPELSLTRIGFNQGSPDAQIKVLEFSDFGCGYCRRFHAETFPTLLKDYIEPGRVEWKYVTYVSGMFPNGRAAALAAECAGEQERFVPMRDLLYERQSEWKGRASPGGTFESLAVEAGADAEEYRRCVAEERPLARIRSGVDLGARLGVRGTPTFLINGIPLVGAQPIEMWADIFTVVEAEAAAAKSAAGPDSSSESRP